MTLLTTADTRMVRPYAPPANGTGRSSLFKPAPPETLPERVEFLERELADTKAALLLITERLNDHEDRLTALHRHYYELATQQGRAMDDFMQAVKRQAEQLLRIDAIGDRPTLTEDQAWSMALPIVTRGLANQRTLSVDESLILAGTTAAIELNDGYAVKISDVITATELLGTPAPEWKVRAVLRDLEEWHMIVRPSPYKYLVSALIDPADFTT